jgi:Dual specificity phosphatase, catalytic domain
VKRIRRYWLIIVLLTATLAVLATHIVIDRLTREEPNYSRIEDGLYLGGSVPEPPPGTRAVLNLCETEDSYHVEVHKWAAIRDAEPAPSIDWLREQVSFVELQRRAGLPTYVHCWAGVSRGGMVTVAYEMAKNNWTRDEALAFVRTQRPQVRPNPAFMQLLLEWEQVVKVEGK